MGRLDVRKKISDAHKGKPVWNKGLTGLPKWSEETREKMKSRTPSMKGKKHSQESKEKMKKSAIGIHRGEKCGTWTPTIAGASGNFLAFF